MLSWKCGIRL